MSYLAFFITIVILFAFMPVLPILILVTIRNTVMLILGLIILAIQSPFFLWVAFKRWATAPSVRYPVQEPQEEE